MAKRLLVSWNGQLVGLIVDVQYETVLAPLWAEDGTPPTDTRPQEAKMRGRWIGASNSAGSEFLSSLKVNDRPEVSVKPYSNYMKVVFALSPDGTAWLYCSSQGR